MMKRIFYAIACAALLCCATACEEFVQIPDDDDHGQTEKPSENGIAPHAIFIYFVGTDLDSWFGQNIKGVMDAVDQNILGNCRIAYFRRVSGGEWAISEISYDDVEQRAVSTMLRRYEDADLSQMGRYLSEMVELVPAETYGLVLGGHGSGWLPKSIGSGWSTKYSAAGQNRHSYYENPFGEAPREDALPTRYFGERAVMFDLEDISAAMQESGAEFEYMLFDDCFMSNIESLYALRHAADYIIASPCEIMAAGFPYRTFIPCLLDKDGPDLKGVCRAFYDFYTNYSTPSGCVALTCCSELEALAEAYAALVAGATNEVDPSKLQYYEGLARHLFYDFGQYAELLSADEQLYEAFRAQFDRAFPESCRLHTPIFYTAFGPSFDSRIDIDYYSGVTVSEPANRNQQLNRETEWYRATHRTESDDESDSESDDESDNESDDESDKKIESNR